MKRPRICSNYSIDFELPGNEGYAKGDFWNSRKFRVSDCDLYLSVYPSGSKLANNNQLSVFVRNTSSQELELESLLISIWDDDDKLMKKRTWSKIVIGAGKEVGEANFLKANNIIEDDIIRIEISIPSEEYEYKRELKRFKGLVGCLPKDVTVKADDLIIEANSSVLGFASPVFKAMINPDHQFVEAGTKEIVIDKCELNLLMEFIYNGEIGILKRWNKENDYKFRNLLKIGDQYRVDGLVEWLAQRIGENCKISDMRARILTVKSLRHITKLKSLWNHFTTWLWENASKEEFNEIATEVLFDS